MNNCGKLVIHERLIVNVSELYNDLKSYEVHDTVFNCMLERQHVQVHYLSDNGKNNLD